MNIKDIENYFDEKESHKEKTFVETNSNEHELIGKKSDSEIINYSYSTSNSLPSGMESLTIGSGKLCGLLGCGGMSKVYKIWNEKLEIFRAVKILLPNQTSDLKDRFETEAKISAKLHHANIIEIYNVGEWSGLPYIEMEFIDGEPLDVLINKRGRLPDNVCCSIALSIAHALAYAHTKELLLYGKEYNGIIHRDLKPANIMISNSGIVKLMDFGIARPAKTSLHTMEGNLVGTIQYLSPEQMDGINIDSRTDIYSFGAILYEMLTGSKTFPQDSITELMKKKIENDYRKISDFGYKITPDLVRVTQKCLHFNKNERFESSEVLLRRLDEIQKKMNEKSKEKIINRYISEPDNKSNITVSYKRIKYNYIVLSIVLVIVTIAGILVFLKNCNEVTNFRQTNFEKVTVDSKNFVSTSDSKVVNILPDLETPPVTQQNPASGKIAENSASVNSKLDKLEKSSIIQPTVKIYQLDRLRKKYGDDNLLNVGKNALRRAAFTDAIKALLASTDTFPDQRRKNLLLFEAYIESGQTGNAVSLKEKLTLKDGWYELLCGKLDELTSKSIEALEHYQKALTKPCDFEDRIQLRNDALYRSALIRNEIYKKIPNADNRNQAINAWKSVMIAYRSNPQDKHAIKASEEIATLK